MSHCEYTVRESIDFSPEFIERRLKSGSQAWMLGCLAASFHSMPLCLYQGAYSEQEDFEEFDVVGKFTL
ncbi:MAG: hypothetical protein ISR28_05180 [SAR86 cluster bacterium]|nr:hypothetical protein [SAR86 cluster bacterium]